jgi:hypothetical protein
VRPNVYDDSCNRVSAENQCWYQLWVLVWYIHALTNSFHALNANLPVPLGDLYQTPSTKILRTLQKDKHLEAGHGRAFRLPMKVPSRNHSLGYQHKTDLVKLKKNFRDEDGSVIVAPRNFVTSPAKSGIVKQDATFGGFPQHMPDDFNHP